MIQAIYIIQEYLEHCEGLGCFWKIDYFKQISYSKWAANELIDLLEHNPNIPPIRLVEEFTEKMDDFSVMDLPDTIMFSIAKDFSENIEDVLRDIEPATQKLSIF